MAITGVIGNSPDQTKTTTAKRSMRLTTGGINVLAKLRAGFAGLNGRQIAAVGMVVAAVLLPRQSQVGAVYVLNGWGFPTDILTSMMALFGCFILIDPKTPFFMLLMSPFVLYVAATLQLAAQGTGPASAVVFYLTLLVFVVREGFRE